MANLDTQVQIKLIEISKEWAEKIDTRHNAKSMRNEYLVNFDEIYERLSRTISKT